MSDSATDEHDIQEAHEQVFVDDAPTSLNTIPLSGYTAINSREKVEVIERIAHVIVEPNEESLSYDGNASQQPSAQLSNGTGNDRKLGGYGNIGGRSSLLQRRLQSGSIHRFDSGEHFRKQAEKKRHDHTQRKQENFRHPLKDDQSVLHHRSSLAGTETDSSAGSFPQSERHHWMHTQGSSKPEVVPRRFASSYDSSDSE